MSGKGIAQKDHSQSCFFAIALAVVTLAAYAGVSRLDFVYDDYNYILREAVRLRPGFSEAQENLRELLRRPAK